MTGCTPSYISNQLGHANQQMLFTVYSKWLLSGNEGEQAKVALALNAAKLKTGT